MRLIIIATVLGLSSLSFGFMEDLDSKFRSMERNQPTTDECADFSGNWVGRCTEVVNDESENYSDDFKLKQVGCRYIVLDENDHTPYVFGGSHSTSEIADWYSFKSIINVDWIREKNAFQAMWRQEFRSLPHIDDKILFIENYKGIYELIGNRLKYEITGKVKRHFISKEKTTKVLKTLSCTYEKI